MFYLIYEHECLLEVVILTLPIMTEEINIMQFVSKDFWCETYLIIQVWLIQGPMQYRVE